MVFLRMTTVYNRVDTVINGALEERPSTNGFQSTEQDSQSTKIHTLNQKVRNAADTTRFCKTSKPLQHWVSLPSLWLV